MLFYEKITMTDENQYVFSVKEGWLNVWEVLCCMDGYSAGRTKEGKHLGPSWEPHLCLLNLATRKLLHFRSEKAAEEYISRLRDDISPSDISSIQRERIGSSKEDFYRRNNLGRCCLTDLLMVADTTSVRTSDHASNNSGLAPNPANQSHYAKMSNFQKSQTLDNRSTPSQMLAGMNEGGDKIYSHSTSVVDKRRGSGSSLCSDESSSKPSTHHQQQNQSKLANFFSRKSQQLKSNLKRTKSATKLDRKKTNGDSDGERMSGCMRTSHSHEALLTSPSEVHNSVDLSHPGITVRPVHSSIWSVEYCFVVSGEGQPLDKHIHANSDTLGIPSHLGPSSGNVVTKYYKCGSDAEMQRWISNIKSCIRSNRDRTFRTDNSLQLSIVESKNLPQKKKYYCELYLDGVLYARTSAKLMQDHVFWGEQFNFGELPNVQTISVHLFREVDKKKKRERPFKIGSIDIPSTEFKNMPICEKWFEVHSSAGRKGTRDSRVEGVGVRIKGRYLSVDILPLHYYHPLLEFIQKDYSAIVELLEPVISVKAKEGLATCLASSLHCTGHVVTFLCDIVMAEVDRLENNALALRGNSIATKAVEAYMKIVGQKYLVSTLKDVLRAVIDSSVDCEVDPGRLSTSSSLTANRHALVTHCTLVWCKIINSSAFFPSELKKLFQMIRLSCESRPNISVSVCRQLISSCIFLRFFCPAILSPNLFSIIQEFPCDRGVRNLTLIAKTIQSLANLTLFGGKEKFMDFMNTFVSHEIVHMQAYLDNISTLSDDDEQRPCDPIIDQSRELALLHSLLVESFKGVSEDGKSKFSDLSNILHNISSTLEEMPAQLQQQHLNSNNNNPSVIPIDESQGLNFHLSRLPSSTVPPFTPTTVVHPASPVKIVPAECTDFPTTSTYVSMISQSLSSAPALLKGVNTGGYHQRPVANELATSGFSNGLVAHFSIPDSNVLNVSVRKAAVALDEQQIERDWKKIIEAAVQSSEGNGTISLVDFSATATTSGDFNFSRSSPLINNCMLPQQDHSEQIPLSESPLSLSFNNPTYSQNHHHPPSYPHSNKKASKHNSKNSVSSSSDNLKASRNLNGTAKTGVLLSQVKNLKTLCSHHSGAGSSINPYRSNSSDSLVNCKGMKSEKSHKVLALPLSSSTPRINKSSEARKLWSQASAPSGSMRTSTVSKSFDETSKPSKDSSSKFPPHSSSSSSSEHALSKLSRYHGNLKHSGDVALSPRRQTVHYDVSPVSTPASPKPGFGTLPLQGLKGCQIQGSSSTPRLQASGNMSASSRLQPSGQTDFASSPSKRVSTEEEAKQRSQRNQHKGHIRVPPHPASSPSLASSTPATPLAESQQVASTRSLSIQTALQCQHQQNRYQQWNSVLEYDRPIELRSVKSNSKIVESPLESELFGRPTAHAVDFHRSFSCSQPRPSSSSSSSTGKGMLDFRPIDPMSPTSMNHARRLEFFNANVFNSRNNYRDDHLYGFEKRDSIHRSSAFGRFTSNKQRDELAAGGTFCSPPASSQISHARAPAGRLTPSSFISLTNQNRRSSKAELVQARQMISPTNQQQSMLVYNVENNASEPIVCKSTSC